MPEVTSYRSEDLIDHYAVHVETIRQDENKLPLESYDIIKMDDGVWIYRFYRHLGEDACPICNQTRTHNHYDDHCDNVDHFTTSTTEEVVELLNGFLVTGENKIELRDSHYDLRGVVKVTIPVRRKAEEKGELPIIILGEYIRADAESNQWTRKFKSFPESKTFCAFCGYNKTHSPSCKREYKKFTTAGVTAELEAYYDQLQTNESVIYASLHIG